MRVLYGPHAGWDLPETSTAVTVGVFDGVHRGHQALLEQLRERGRGRPVVVLTFSRHPDSVIAPERSPRSLTMPSQRTALLEGLGVDIVAHLEFDEATRDTPAPEFIRQVLAGSLNAALIAVGRDFRFGRGGTGDVALLQEMSVELGYEVVLLSLVGENEPVSSTRIRSHVRAGEIEAAASLLGRPYAVDGRVEPGEGRGRAVGVPTANLAVHPNQLLPGRGVYAVSARIAGSLHRGVANIGTRPTFDGTRIVVEVHVLDFGGELYGEEITVEFLHRIRDERKFLDVKELVCQIRADIDAARGLFSDAELTGGQ